MTFGSVSTKEALGYTLNSITRRFLLTVKEISCARSSFSKRNLKFLLYDVFDVLSLTRYQYYFDRDRGDL